MLAAHNLLVVFQVVTNDLFVPEFFPETAVKLPRLQFYCSSIYPF